MSDCIALSQSSICSDWAKGYAPRSLLKDTYGNWTPIFNDVTDSFSLEIALGSWLSRTELTRLLPQNACPQWVRQMPQTLVPAHITLI